MISQKYKTKAMIEADLMAYHTRLLAQCFIYKFIIAVVFLCSAAIIIWWSL